MIPAKKILVLNEHDEVVSYPIFFEDFPEGCGSCGGQDHVFETCPRRLGSSAPGGRHSGAPTSAGFDGANQKESIDAGSSWVKVVARKKSSSTLVSVGHSKAELFQLIGSNVICNSDSSSSKLSIKSAGQGSSVGAVAEPESAPIPPPVVEAPELEQLGVGASSNSESSKRKGGLSESDTASSQLKGSMPKKLKYDQ